MSTLVAAARRLADHRPGHCVISLYLDLDPGQFATPPARTAQVDSLIDEAAKNLDETNLAHEDRVAVRADLVRLREFLTSEQAPYEGARALAVFCSGPSDLFEVVQLPRSVSGRVVLDTSPYIEPLLAAAEQRQWYVVLVNRRDARIFAGTVDELAERRDLQDDVHGQHDRGGLSQTHHQRSIEKDVDDHLRRVAAVVDRDFRRARFDRLALGGPREIVPRLEGFLSDEVAAHLAAGRVDVDVASSTETEVRTAVAGLAQDDDRRVEGEALKRMAAGIGTGGRGAGGPEDTVAALNQRRVQTLLMEAGFDRHARRCPACGMLLLDGGGRCPAEGTELEEIEHLREAAVEAALAQDAEVLFVRYHPDLGPFRGIGAILRF